MKSYKKVACIIQARTGSTRLPNKVNMKIENKPILEHIIDFLKFSKLTDEIIIATTELPEDDIIEKIGIQNKVKVFRGSKNDVLSRYFFCAKQFHIDIVVRITADNPLIDPHLVDQVIKDILNGEYDYVSNMIEQTYPSGYLVEAFTFTTLEKIYNSKTDSYNKEHVTPDLRKNFKNYKTKNIRTPKNLERNSWRLTLDYKKDLSILKKIFKNLYRPNNYISYESVVNFLDHNESILDNRN